MSEMYTREKISAHVGESRIPFRITYDYGSWCIRMSCESMECTKLHRIIGNLPGDALMMAEGDELLIYWKDSP